MRLYAVDAAGRRGVVFLSMEASRLLTVLGVRVALQLPYVWSSMSIRVDETVEYSSRRLGPRHPQTHLRCDHCLNVSSTIRSQTS